ncbi:MAG TPA: hypothetical protein EYF94_08065 [Porticoccaceae bacterium]|nr:hypothetical protein [Gammaproteobacteria bacterium]HIK80876.1 hypothetical protein [Porticoccaceae bacterium]
MISMPGLFQRSARLNPEEVATRYNGRSRLWPQILDRVASFAGAKQFMAEQGINVRLQNAFFFAVYGVKFYLS